MTQQNTSDKEDMDSSKTTDKIFKRIWWHALNIKNWFHSVWTEITGDCKNTTLQIDSEDDECDEETIDND